MHRSTQAAITLMAPTRGRLVPLTEVQDEAFASGALGQGAALEPEDGLITAPIGGEIIVAMTHAYGILTPDGVEVLVHIGIDTVTLNGGNDTSRWGQLGLTYSQRASPRDPRYPG